MLVGHIPLVKEAASSSSSSSLSAAAAVITDASNALHPNPSVTSNMSPPSFSSPFLNPHSNNPALPVQNNNRISDQFLYDLAFPTDKMDVTPPVANEGLDGSALKSSQQQHLKSDASTSSNGVRQSDPMLLSKFELFNAGIGLKPLESPISPIGPGGNVFRDQPLSHHQPHQQSQQPHQHSHNHTPSLDGMQIDTDFNYPPPSTDNHQFNQNLASWPRKSRQSLMQDMIPSHAYAAFLDQQQQIFEQDRQQKELNGAGRPAVPSLSVAVGSDQFSSLPRLNGKSSNNVGLGDVSDGVVDRTFQRLELEMDALLASVGMGSGQQQPLDTSVSSPFTAAVQSPFSVTTQYTSSPLHQASANLQLFGELNLSQQASLGNLLAPNFSSTPTLQAQSTLPFSPSSTSTPILDLASASADAVAMSSLSPSQQATPLIQPSFDVNFLGHDFGAGSPGVLLNGTVDMTFLQNQHPTTPSSLPTPIPQLTSSSFLPPQSSTQPSSWNPNDTPSVAQPKDVNMSNRDSLTTKFEGLAAKAAAALEASNPPVESFVEKFHVYKPDGAQKLKKARTESPTTSAAPVDEATSALEELYSHVRSVAAASIHGGDESEEDDEADEDEFELHESNGSFLSASTVVGLGDMAAVTREGTNGLLPSDTAPPPPPKDTVLPNPSIVKVEEDSFHPAPSSVFSAESLPRSLISTSDFSAHGSLGRPPSQDLSQKTYIFVNESENISLPRSTRTTVASTSPPPAPQPTAIHRAPSIASSLLSRRPSSSRRKKSMDSSPPPTSSSAPYPTASLTRRPSSKRRPSVASSHLRKESLEKLQPSSAIDVPPIPQLPLLAPLQPTPPAQQFQEVEKAMEDLQMSDDPRASKTLKKRSSLMSLMWGFGKRVSGISVEEPVEHSEPTPTQQAVEDSASEGAPAVSPAESTPKPKLKRSGTLTRKISKALLKAFTPSNTSLTETSTSSTSDSTTESATESHKEKPYPCPTCSRSFLRRHDLRRHELIHKQDAKVFICEVCENTFTRADALGRHIKGGRCKGPPAPVSAGGKDEMMDES
ncbi:Metallothionein expression activator [Chytridiales sp. JEL 0842]|nr:Metallothionein expression activator [Chytridiales sp. JEL 0842]